jgi:NAD(P)-dependent dehydrogenase (short-subunit alcohol dehydrogenase family)
MNIHFNVDLSNSVAVLTGGGGVLCSCFSEALAAYGSKVAILDINKEAAQKVADKIKRNGGTALAVKGDVLDSDSLVKAKNEILDTFDKITILINGAGGNHPKGTTSHEFLMKSDLKEEKNNITTFFDLKREGVDFVFDLNFLGTFLTTQIFAKEMIDQEGAVIINISSMNSFKPLTKIPAYSAAKAAVSNFTQWLAVYLSKVNIRVNAIAPGFFLTEQNRSLLIREDGSYTERAKKIVGQTPMGRFGEPEELIGTLLWLINNNASGFVNGIVVPVDGGFNAYSGV